jgi:F-type H+-transporting ATPase subunit epsilon
MAEAKTGKKLTLDLVTPQKVVFSKPVHMVVVPGLEGDFGVLAEHAPLVSSMRSGVVDVYENGEQVTQRIFVSGGFTEVSGTECTVLAEEAIDLKEAKRSDAEARLEHAKKAQAKAPSAIERDLLQKQIDVAQALLDVVR